MEKIIKILSYLSLFLLIVIVSILFIYPFYSGVLAARREQDFVEQLVSEVEVTEATADTDDDDDETLDCCVHVRAPP